MSVRPSDHAANPRARLLPSESPTTATRTARAGSLGTVVGGAGSGSGDVLVVASAGLEERGRVADVAAVVRVVLVAGATVDGGATSPLPAGMVVTEA
jgi:hypothetical protein